MEILKEHKNLGNSFVKEATMIQTRVMLLLTLLVLVLPSAFAQTYTTKKTAKGAAKKAFEKGMVYNVEGDNLKAIREFEKALKEAPDFIDAQLQWAAMKYDLKLFPEAEIGFEKVVIIDPLYNSKVLYTLGIAESRQEKFAEAAEHFQQYLDTQPKNETLRRKAKRHLANCIFRSEVGNKRVPFEPKSIGETINTPANEYLPSLTADGATLVYTAREGNQEDFYISRRVEDGWRKGRPMEDINTSLSEGAQSISADGKFLVFTACNRKEGEGSCDLYFSEVKNGRWTKPANMGVPINSRAWESQPSISADGKTLYFSWAPQFQQPKSRHPGELSPGRWLLEQTPEPGRRNQYPLFRTITFYSSRWADTVFHVQWASGFWRARPVFVAQASRWQLGDASKFGLPDQYLRIGRGLGHQPGREDGIFFYRSC